MREGRTERLVTYVVVTIPWSGPTQGRIALSRMGSSMPLSLLPQQEAARTPAPFTARLAQEE